MQNPEKQQPAKQYDPTTPLELQCEDFSRVAALYEPIDNRVTLCTIDAIGRTSAVSLTQTELQRLIAILSVKHHDMQNPVD